MAATLPRKNRTNHNPQNLPHIWWQRFYGLTIFYSARDRATSDSSDDSLQQLSVWKVSGGPLCCTFCCIVLCNYFLLSDCIYCDLIFFFMSIVSFLFLVHERVRVRGISIGHFFRSKEIPASTYVRERTFFERYPDHVFRRQ